jgi:hypothetical protein
MVQYSFLTEVCLILMIVFSVNMSQVHHIDASGQDSGVVYSEIQGRQNTSSDLMDLRFAFELVASARHHF